MRTATATATATARLATTTRTRRRARWLVIGVGVGGRAHCVKVTSGATWRQQVNSFWCSRARSILRTNKLSSQLSESQIRVEDSRLRPTVARRECGAPRARPSKTRPTRARARTHAGRAAQSETRLSVCVCVCRLPPLCALQLALIAPVAGSSPVSHRRWLTQLRSARYWRTQQSRWPIAHTMLSPARSPDRASRALPFASINNDAAFLILCATMMSARRHQTQQASALYLAAHLSLNHEVGVGAR